MTKTHTKRILEEKENLINAFFKSNQSMTKWCKDNQIPVTTFNDWIRRRKSKVTFIPLEHSVNTVKTFFGKYTNPDLIIEFKDFKITINNNSSIELLEKTMKVVKNLYVSL